MIEMKTEAKLQAPQNDVPRRIGELGKNGLSPNLITSETLGQEACFWGATFFHTLQEMLDIHAEIMLLRDSVASIDDVDTSRKEEVVVLLETVWLEGKTEIEKVLSHLSSIDSDGYINDSEAWDKIFFIVKHFSIMQTRLREEIYSLYFSLDAEANNWEDEHLPKMLGLIESSIAHCLVLAKKAADRLGAMPTPSLSLTGKNLWRSSR